MTNTANVLLAMFFFLAPLIYKLWKKEQIELADLGKCAVPAMGLPNLFTCLYYLVVNPAEVLKMAELPQYLTIGVLTILFLTSVSITEIFTKPPRHENASIRFAVRAGWPCRYSPCLI